MKFDNALAIGTAVCGLVLSAGSAQAGVPDAGEQPAASQQVPATSQQPPATTEAPSASAEAGTSYSDAELEQFAKAVMAVQQIQQDTAISATDKQTKMAAAVQETGLTAEKFNEIASASNSDPALMQRIQVAASQIQSTGTPQ